jgi:hypothetical protein
LAAEGAVLERPSAFVATRTKVPAADAVVVTCKVADVPVEAMVVDVTVTGSGTDAGVNVNVESVRLWPCTCIEIVDPARASAGWIVVMLGGTVKWRAEVAVSPPTVTVIGPVVAPGGAVTTSCVLVAERIGADTPLKPTWFSAGMALNPRPWMVTRVPTTP